MQQIKQGEKSGKVDFSKVMKMIDDMVATLGQEQKDDAEHLEFCRGEFDASEDKQKELEGAIKALSSSISEMSDEIKSLASEVAAAEQRIQETDKAVAEASDQRKAEHAEFTATVQANQMAIELIGKAKNKLQLFYNPELATPETPAPTPSPYAFLQLKAGQPGPAPETFGDSYEKKSGKSTGVMGLMDKMIRELETDVQEAEHEEETAQKDYEELMAESQKSNEEETKKIAHKSKAKADLESSLEESKRGNALKEEALGELKTYIQELHGSCDFIVANFETRRAAREAESQSLQNAKAVLSGASFN
jgi:septal ring factor EnvC (AmiA/AmiB activator)